jgi:GNAT superfamily N-acetyltransferase
MKATHIVDLGARAHEPAVVALLAEAQIHRAPAEAAERAPAIAGEYASGGALRLWGYERAGEVVGVAGVEGTGGKLGIVRDLAVAPDARREGVGRALLEFLRTDARFRELAGDTLESAAGFYRRCGFDVCPNGTMPDGATRYRFEWRAGPAGA